MNARAIFLRLLAACAVWVVITAPVAAANEPKPSFLHGVGQVVGGLVVEMPKTVLESTLSGPPVAGLLIGLLAGVARALEMTFKGVQEISTSFNPWAVKR